MDKQMEALMAILRSKTPIPPEEWAIVDVLYDDQPGPYEESPEEQDKMDEIEHQCEKFEHDYDLAKRLGTVDEVFIVEDGTIQYRCSQPRKRRGH
jgi:hypothetical protein